MNAQTLSLHALARPTPFAFPLMIERYREQLSSESVADRIARMVEQLELAAGGDAGGGEAGVGDAGSRAVMDAPIALDAVGRADRVKAGLAFGQEGGDDRRPAASSDGVGDEPAPAPGTPGAAAAAREARGGRSRRRERRPSRPLPPL
jgi:ATP-dependent Lhr-like helicase